jgi:predicted nuclease of predicted toxin-antitoxin system
MNLSPRWCDLLNSAGFAAAHWPSIGVGDAPDREIMSYSASSGYIVLTHDLDFGAILTATGRTSPSVVQIRATDVSPALIGTQVVFALRQMKDELASGALVTVDADRTRLPLLPLRRSADTEHEKQ